LIDRLAANSLGDDLIESAEKVAPVAALLSSHSLSLKHAIAATSLLRHIISFEEIDMMVVTMVVSCLGYKHDLAQDLELLNKNLKVDYQEASSEFDKGSQDAGAFASCLHAVLTSESYPTSIRKVMSQGGGCCSRASVVGACLGALYGIGGDKGIPLEWMDRTEGIREIVRLAIDRVGIPFVIASQPQEQGNEESP
jgi:ADP-ribosylglycohydrolase